MLLLEQPVSAQGTHSSLADTAEQSCTFRHSIHFISGPMSHSYLMFLQILNNRTTSCVCHGISGTCSIQTCYQKVPDVGVVGSQLQFKYNGAVKVKMDATTKNLVPVRPDIDQNITSDLVYMGDSPDFCRQTTQDGVLGTKDRICIPDSESLNSCNILCCGRGHYRKVSVVRAPPRCEFVWCCRFECVETGNHTIIEHRCN